LLEDYWEKEWDKVEQDFAEMRALGANCVRIHLQFGKFMDGPDQPNQAALRQLERLMRLAEQQQLYVDLTGLGCYHKQDIPAWYDALDESDDGPPRAVSGRQWRNELLTVLRCSVTT